MKPHGLIGDEWILSYAAGSLSEAHALVVASHVDYHPELQEKVRDAEDIGGALMEQSAPVEMAGTNLDDLMSMLDDLPQEAPVSDAKSKSRSSDLPASLAAYLGKDTLSGLKWRMMGPGMSQVRLWTGPNDERLWLLKAKGGTQMPSHDHNGLEMTLVLQGSYKVGDEHYTPGLVEVADDDTKNHEPIIDEGEDCICLVVTEAPIKLHSLIGRLVQPFIGL